MSVGVSPIGVPSIACAADDTAYRSAGDSENFWILTGRLSDLATITTVGAQQMAAANLQNRDPTRKWRGTGRSESLLFTFPAPTICNALFWGGHNHTRGGTLRVLMGDTAAGGVITSVAQDTNFASAWPLGIKPTGDAPPAGWPSILRWANTTPYTYYQVDVGDDGAGLVDLECGRAMLGEAWQPDDNCDFGARIAPTSNDFFRLSTWNRPLGSRRLAGRTIRLPFSMADESDAIDQAMDLQLSLGTALDLVVALDPASTARFHRKTIHGTFSEMSEFEPVPFWNGNGYTYKFELAIREV